MMNSEGKNKRIRKINKSQKQGKKTTDRTKCFKISR